MTLPEFANVFATLAVQLRQTDADEVTIRSYFEVLKDCELGFVRLAAERFARTAEWFPKTSEWRAATIAIAIEQRDSQREQLRRLPAPVCETCGDTGWAPTTYLRPLSEDAKARLRAERRVGLIMAAKAEPGPREVDVALLLACVPRDTELVTRAAALAALPDDAFEARLNERHPEQGVGPCACRAQWHAELASGTPTPRPAIAASPTPPLPRPLLRFGASRGPLAPLADRCADAIAAGTLDTDARIMSGDDDKVNP